MFKTESKRLDEVKEKVIAAMEEHYEGETEIEDVAQSPYDRMVLNQDRKIIDVTNNFIADAASCVIEIGERYLEEINSHNPKNAFRNREFVENFIEDIYKQATILSLSIRRNNAEWQYMLSQHSKNNEGFDIPMSDKIKDIFSGMGIKFDIDEEGDEFDDDEE